MNLARQIIFRLRLSAPWALRHLLLSVAIGGLIAFLMVRLWFPQPFLNITGGWKLFFLIVMADVVCGPILTLLLIYPDKSRVAKFVDIALIFTVQLAALCYGIFSLSQARPIAMLFEVDRFRIISYADIDNSNPKIIPKWVNAWSFEPPRFIGIRSARSPQEKAESIEASLQGVEPSQRPNWWQEYELSVPQIKSRALPLDVLLALNPKLIDRIQSSAAQAANGVVSRQEAVRPAELLWLPVVSRMSMDWVAFVDPHTGRIRGYVQADGFGR